MDFLILSKCILLGIFYCLFLVVKHRNDQPCKDEGYATHLIAKEACRIIREKNPDKPLFLYLPFNAVHGPFQVPEKYCEPYANLK